MTTPSPLVSVIIPTYNSERFIVSAVDSVLAQTYKKIEIIVVDDGSTDQTSNKLKPYLHKIKYIKKQNGGASSARNKGIINSCGEYIAFLDADDLWRKEKVEKQISIFAKNPDIGLVYCDSATFDGNGVIHPSLKKIVETPTGEVMMDMVIHNFLNNSSVLVKKSCFDIVGLWNEKLINGNDYDMWLRVAAHTKFDFVDQVLVETCYHSHGLSGLTDLQCENSIKIQEDFICKVEDDIE
ncbi:MAG: glycosyltransferase, partial [Candidatus Heimdallarchaeota archaeon]|nr:glycosyltransferase [Candidatus Heimdallarchaeota archaeon]